jgi:hypothetical protein
MDRDSISPSLGRKWFPASDIEKQLVAVLDSDVINYPPVTKYLRGT